MDKLELDTRVARLERRVSLLTTVLILAAAGAAITIYFARIGVSEAAATVVGPPVMTPAPSPRLRPNRSRRLWPPGCPPVVWAACTPRGRWRHCITSSPR